MAVYNKGKSIARNAISDLRPRGLEENLTLVVNYNNEFTEHDGEEAAQKICLKPQNMLIQ